MRRTLIGTIIAGLLGATGYIASDTLFGADELALELATTTPAEPCFADPIKYESDEYRLFRFLAKLEKYRGTEYWNNPTVQRVLTNGEPDMEKIKLLFEERGLTSDFDAAAAKIPKKGNKHDINENCIARFDAIETERAQDVAQIYSKATTTNAFKDKQY